MRIGIREFFTMPIKVVHDKYMTEFHKVLPDHNVCESEGVYYLLPPGITTDHEEIGRYAFVRTKPLHFALQSADFIAWEKVQKKWFSPLNWKIAGVVECPEVDPETGEILRGYVVMFGKTPLWIFAPVVGVFPESKPGFEVKSTLLNDEFAFQYEEEGVAGDSTAGETIDTISETLHGVTSVSIESGGKKVEMTAGEFNKACDSIIEDNNGTAF